MTVSLNLAATTVAASDRAAVRSLAVSLTPGLVDDPGWVSRARALSCALPEELRRVLRDFRRCSGRDGLLLIRDLPLDVESLPPTPCRALSVQRDATVPAAVLVLFMSQLGELVAFRPEKSGALVQDVVPVPGQEKMQGNAGSTRLEMHTENAFHPHRPDFLALLCLRGDHDGSAGLQVASIRRALPLLPEDVVSVLAEPRFVTAAPPSFGDAAGDAVPQPVLRGTVDDPDLVVDFAATRAVDAAGSSALAALGEALSSVGQTAVLSPGDLVIVDNRMAVHGRTAFTPRYDGRDRWLQRTFVHLDFRRSRALRALDGHVVV